MFKFILFICDINQLLSFLIEFSPFIYLKVLFIHIHGTSVNIEHTFNMVGYQ